MTRRVSEGGGPALGLVGNAYGIRAALATGAAFLSPALLLYGLAARVAGSDAAPLDVLPQAEA